VSEANPKLSSKILSIKEIGSDGPRVILRMRDKSGDIYDLPLSVPDVATLVSGLYAFRDKVLNQPRDDAPESVAPIHNIRIGTDQAGIILRIYSTPTFYQDFAADWGTPLASALDLFSKAWPLYWVKKMSR